MKLFFVLTDDIVNPDDQEAVRFKGDILFSEYLPYLQSLGMDNFNAQVCFDEYSARAMSKIIQAS